MNDSQFLKSLEEAGAKFGPTIAPSGARVFNNGAQSNDALQGVLDFGDALAEYEALTGGVGVADFSRRTHIVLTGADRAAFLHNMCTNQIRDLKPGAGCEAFLTNAQGHVLAHVHVLCHDEMLAIETVPDQEPKLLAWLDRYLIREKVELLGQSEPWAELLLAGQNSSEILKSFSIDAPQRLLDHISSKIGAVSVDVCRVEMTRGGGFLIRCDRESLADVWTQLRAAGATQCGATAVEMARIEAGTPYFGPDITDKNLPQEIGRDARAISFVKGCYIGQETVARIDALGHVNRTLTGVSIETNAPPAPETELIAAGKSVAQVTSSALSPRLGRALALAYVRRGSNTPGTQLESPAGAAHVVALPLA